MEWSDLQKARLALFSELASRIPAASMGRTMLMKLCFFLQELKGVPLGYRFTIYSYGPFDSDVLSDLGSAVSMNGIKSTVVYNSVGYGYKLQAGPKADAMKMNGRWFLDQHQASIDWAVAEFGQKSVADLELESTTVFVDCEANGKGERVTLDLLTDRVRNLKSHFQRDYVLERAKDLYQRGLLKAVEEGASKVFTAN